MDTRSIAWSRHPRALDLAYADLESHGLQRRNVFVGTPGSVVVRSNAAGVHFYVHQYYDADKKQRERYLTGPVGAPEADAKAEALRVEIRDANGIVPILRLLCRERFARIDGPVFAAIARLNNSGGYDAGAMAVGQHAYGAMANRMGVRIDIRARGDEREAIAFGSLPPPEILAMMREENGALTLALSSRRDAFPYLDYLLAESQNGLFLSRTGCCPVRLPVPERFALHDLLLAERRPRGAATLMRRALPMLAAVAELFPGAIADAVKALPKRAIKHFTKARAKVKRVLEIQAPRAWEELS